LFLNIGGDTESSEALLAMAPQAKEKCVKVDGKRVCFEGGVKKKNDDDDDDNGDDDDDDKPKKKQKKDVDTGLTECTIQQPGGGGGCKTGFKQVCEKMKSGKKCCGCVPDPNAKAQTTPVQANVCCKGFSNKDELVGLSCAATEAKARQDLVGVVGGAGSRITCAPCPTCN
jgi:hypothetical protein